MTFANSIDVFASPLPIDKVRIASMTWKLNLMNSLVTAMAFTYIAIVIYLLQEPEIGFTQDINILEKEMLSQLA